MLGRTPAENLQKDAPSEGRLSSCGSTWIAWLNARTRYTITRCGMRRLNCLGLKCAISCCILSAWGIMQLGTMGVLFHTRSIAFLDDVPESGPDFVPLNASLFYARVEEGYDKNALNCWIGASFYCTFLVFSLCQCVMNYWEMQNDRSKSLATAIC